MCGIWVYVNGKNQHRTLSDTTTVKCVNTLSNRGPESSVIQQYKHVILGFCRLAINDLSPAGMQPMSQNGVHWICNGEIYNWKELRDRLGIQCSSASDCSILGPLWEYFNKNPIQFFRALDGVFALAIYDEKSGMLVVGRDPYGVRPLFKGYSNFDGDLCFGSEIKSLIRVSDKIQPILPGHFLIINAEENIELSCQKYHTIPWLKNPIWSPQYEHGLERACEAIRESLRIAVRKRLMTERPIAALLSGGVDSSLICALLQSELKRAGVTVPLKTFSIGFEGSPDLFHARLVAGHIGSDHTEIKVAPQDFISAIPEVIRTIESYDITTVRASVGNWMVAREIRGLTDCKVVFNGDGSDEIFGSYLYFFRAPSDEAFEAESARLLEDIHLYDVLRSDRSISSHGLEPRTPYLDKQFVAVARAVCTQWRRPVSNGTGEYPSVEKWILRKAFSETGLLPDAVLWRQKEAFSDGVSRTGTEQPWYKQLSSFVSGIDNWADKSEEFTHLKPITAEAYYYRSIFESIYGSGCKNIIKYFWMPKWSGETGDPSARTLSIYK